MATYYELDRETRENSFFYIQLTIDRRVQYFNIGPDKCRSWDVDDYINDLREAKKYERGFYDLKYMGKDGKWRGEEVDLRNINKINGWIYDHRNLDRDGDPVGYGDLRSPGELQRERDADERRSYELRRSAGVERRKKEAELKQAIHFDKKVAEAKRKEIPNYLSVYEKIIAEEEYLKHKAKFDNTTIGELGNTVGYREYFKTLNNLYIKPLIVDKKMHFNQRTLEEVQKEKQQVESLMTEIQKKESVKQQKKQEELEKKKKLEELEKSKKLRDEKLAKEKLQELNEKRKREKLEEDQKLRNDILAKEKLQELEQQRKRKLEEWHQSQDTVKRLKRDSSFYSNLTESMFGALRNNNLFLGRKMNHIKAQKFLSNFNSKEAIDIFIIDCQVHLLYDISIPCSGDCGYALVSSGEDLFFLVRFFDRNPVIYQLNSGQLKMNLLMEIKEVNAARYIFKHQDRISRKHFQSKNEFHEMFVDFIRAINKTIIDIN